MRLFDSTAEVSEAITEVGLGQWHDQLLGLARPTIRYASIGTSRAGGTPDLHPKLKWPIRRPYPDAAVRNAELRDHPAHEFHSNEQKERNRRRDELIAKDAFLPFIAQIDLAEAWGQRHFDVDLPRHGRLLFFYDAREHPYGFDPPDITGFRVIWDDAPVADLMRAVGPDELAIDCLVLPAKMLHGTAGLMLPDRETFAYEALNIPVQELD